MFSIPLNPKLNETELNYFVNFCNKYKKNIYDIYITTRIAPFLQDAMGDVFDQDQVDIALNNAIGVSKMTGIPLSATFNNIEVPPTEENLDLWIENYKPIYNLGIVNVTLPHTIWLMSNKIQKEFPNLYIKNTILRNVQRPNELVELVKAGFSYINLDRDLMRDRESLLAIKEAKEYCIEKYNRDIKVSILANEGCWGNCPVQDEHFQYNNARNEHNQATYFLTSLSNMSCPKWELDDKGFELKRANIPPWREDWVEMLEDLGIDVFKMHGRESIPRLFETLDIIKRYSENESILWDNFNEYISDANLENAPINIWREKIKTCKFNCWKCNYCEDVVEARSQTTLITHVKKAISDAMIDKSNVSEKALKIEGLTSNKVKHLLSNICMMPNITYLEVGTYLGATLLSATNSTIKSIAIDDWSTPQMSPMKEDIEFDIKENPKELFYKNIKGMNNITVLDEKIEDVMLDSNMSIDVFFYDGDHSKDSYKVAFNKLNNNFSDVFIAIIDDYNWKQVEDSINEIYYRYDILYDNIIRTKGEDPNDFWNGLRISILKNRIEEVYD